MGRLPGLHGAHYSKQLQTEGSSRGGHVGTEVQQAGFPLRSRAWPRVTWPRGDLGDTPDARGGGKRKALGQGEISNLWRSISYVTFNYQRNTLSKRGWNITGEAWPNWCMGKARGKTRLPDQGGWWHLPCHGQPHGPAPGAGPGEALHDGTQTY